MSKKILKDFLESFENIVDSSQSKFCIINIIIFFCLFITCFISFIKYIYINKLNNLAKRTKRESRARK